MDNLPHSVLLHILSLLDDSADVARCRVASKAFDTVFPGLRSVNLRCSTKWYDRSRPSVSSTKPFNTVFLDLISKLESVESVRIFVESWAVQGFNLTDDDFAEEWLPRVSRSLKSLSISDCHTDGPSNFLSLISAYLGHNLVRLKLKSAYLSVLNMNPMPMLTSLTLKFTTLNDQGLNILNRCFPNLQRLKLDVATGHEDPMIHLLNLKTCYWYVYDKLRSLTLITPNLVTLTLKGVTPTALHVEAPMLSHFHLSLYAREHAQALTIKKFEKLKTLWLESSYIGSFISQFPVTETVETLTLDAGDEVIMDFFTLGEVFTVFPNVSSLCIKSGPWLEFEACINREGWEILDGGKELKTICAYLVLVNPSLTFKYVACILDQCVGLSEFSLLIHGDVVGIIADRFMSNCMARWPGLKWRWGIWGEDLEDTWITPRFIKEAPLVMG